MIPEYILKAAKEYQKVHGGSEALFDAFIAGHKATRQPKAKDIVLTPEQDRMFDECWKAYGKKGNKGKSKEVWSKIPLTSLPIILTHIKIYVSSRQRCFQKDFERYLKEKVYTTNIVTNEGVLYDSEKDKFPDEYRPTTDGIFQLWNPERNCLILNNGYIDQLNDGYTDDTRPDGARVAWSMYEWVWSSQTKQWIKQND